jgi:hypothetical protein
VSLIVLIDGVLTLNGVPLTELTEAEIESAVLMHAATELSIVRPQVTLETTKVDLDALVDEQDGSATGNEASPNDRPPISIQRDIDSSTGQSSGETRSSLDSPNEETAMGAFSVLESERTTAQTFSDAGMPDDSREARSSVKRRVAIGVTIAVVIVVVIFTLTSTLTHNTSTYKVNFADELFATNCASASRSYPTFNPSLPVLVYGPNRQVVATGRLGTGFGTTDVDESGKKVKVCYFFATITNIPRNLSKYLFINTGEPIASAVSYTENDFNKTFVAVIQLGFNR